jgi:hypothetical protein
MHFSLPIIAAALFSSGSEAARRYESCKCHDSNTGLQVDWVTKATCEKYHKEYPQPYAVYSDEPHHQACWQE